MITLPWQGVRVQPTRRQLLSGAALGLAVACTEKTPAAPVVRVDDRLRQEAGIREEALIALYASAVWRFPVLAAELRPLMDQHQQHRQALGLAVLPSPTPQAEPVLLRSPAEARRNLGALEKGTAQGHAAALAGAGPELAQVLASLSACEAGHAEALR